MVFMAWNDELATGIAEIDAQHRWLIDTTNRLHEQLSSGRVDREIVGDVLEGLVDYTMNHFIAEEELFERHHYPEATPHKIMHNKLSATTMQVLQNFEAGGDVGVEVLDFLKDWLQNHIMKADKAYATFMKARGVS